MKLEQEKCNCKYNGFSSARQIQEMNSCICNNGITSARLIKNCECKK